MSSADSMAGSNAVSDALRSALARVLAGERPGRAEIQGLLEGVLEGEMDPVLLGGFLVSLSQRGETAEEIAGVAAALRTHMAPFEHDARDAIDTCGTGGDGLGTFNLSTASAFVAAAAGARVVKHGNRSVSSKSGSADVLEALGGRLDVHDDVARRALDETGFTFLFAPRFHPAMRHAAPVRKALGIRTVFNLVGPLCNPGGVRRQVLGVASPELQVKVAGALESLGVDAAYVVHGDGGTDELSLGPGNRVLALGGAVAHDFAPEPLGLTHVPVSALAGGDAAHNARLMRDLLGGAKGPLRDATCLNAAAALVVAGVAENAASGVRLAKEAIDRGRALATLDGWVRVTREGAQAS
ncbi:Anthranilate phosphoribosyltransferase [Planctomycetes bacterium Poly30]|uniref:Anthranilate phosphoribosyltransferase n=1 Tax=Saltatorellus ferox TaxID=2528018 RepID=A0A518EV77_9BACT|nr:Anthranilate phosphoribosyltransferase [Planctomycetes bacterium Poly30]